MKWSPEGRWITTGFGVVLMLMGGISFTSYQNATQLAENANKVRQTHEVLETLIGILSAVNEAEAGRRGYILFNDRSELERYNRAIQVLEPKLNRLQTLFVDQAKQQQQLEVLGKLIDQRLDFAQQSIELHQRNPAARSAQTELRVASIHNRQEIQKLFAVMQQEEEQALEQRVNQSRSNIRLRMLLEFLGTLVTFLILFGIFALLYQQLIQRQRAEALQQQLTQEKALSELKLQFFSMVSHEFRTPLSSILGSAQILDETLQPLVGRQKLKSLYRIRSSTQLMTQLLSDILTLARAEAGKLEFNPRPLEIQSFCLNLIEDLQPLSKSNHSIQFIIQGECKYADVDERLLYSILSNLVSNSIKYSPNGGTIDFIIRCEPSLLKFIVRDQGIGIPSKTQEILYEPFHRGRNVGGILGTGLGLAVVKKCLDLHGGTISVESEVDVGTTFTVKIPQ